MFFSDVGSGVGNGKIVKTRVDNTHGIEKNSLDASIL